MSKLNINASQTGIPFFPPHAKFLTFFITDSARNDKPSRTYAKWIKAAQKIEHRCAQSEDFTAAIKGVDYLLWNQWCDKNMMAKPKGMTSHKALERLPFKHTGGSFWYYIKAETKSVCEDMAAFIIQLLKPMTSRYTTTYCNDRHSGRILGGCFPHGIANPVDEVNLSYRTIVGDNDPFYRGSVFVFQQKFKFNWDRINDMSLIEKENMIGETTNGSILPKINDRSHLKCVRKNNGENVSQQMLRQALPYGEVAGAQGKEEGAYFVSYANDGRLFEEVLGNISGPDEGYIRDRLLGNSYSVSGNFWFVPQASLLGLDGISGHISCPLQEYFDISSDNGYMSYNNREFLHNMRSSKLSGVDAVSDRILLQVAETFHRWNDTMRTNLYMPPLGHLQDYMTEEAWKSYKHVADGNSAALRKGLATKISLCDVLWRDEFIKKAGLFKIEPYELIVGTLPPLNLGSGSRVMEYLTPVEKIEYSFSKLNEYSMAGHNIPDYFKVLRLGIPGLLNEAKNGLSSASSGETCEFYQSVVYALEGLQSFVQRYSALAIEYQEKTPGTDMHTIADRMQRLAFEKPSGFHDSLQLIFIVNCALHLIGDPMSIGRLDQLLIEAYRSDIKNQVITPEEAQELIDSFWLKMDEPVLYQRQNMEDFVTYGSGAVFFSAGNFPQGSAMNQWVQQVTIGGYLPTDENEPTDGCNEITLMCLRSARRLPLNAPCLTLRMHNKMKSELHEQIFSEASKAILSGGAHPILANDDKLCPALAKCHISMRDSRDYAPDGCYEPIICGKSEWCFSYLPLLPIVGMAMNQGATIAGAGWMYLNGLKSSWNSPAPDTIKSFDEFMEIFYTHFIWQINSFYNTLMNNYGALWNVAPSPLFSAICEGCMESGKDMTNGGATYHIMTPEMNCITNTINSLYNVQKLVFDQDTALTTLPELLDALRNNWGKDMQEPFYSELEGTARKQIAAQRYAKLREVALSLPKFGLSENEELKVFGSSVVENLVRLVHKSIENPIPAIKKGYDAIKEKYSVDGSKFVFSITPGVGTFEDNIGLGAGMGASADGRLSGEATGDDFSPAPSPIDAPPSTEIHDVFSCLKNWNTDPINFGIANASPVDINVREDFPLNDMKKLLKQFADGEIGSNMLSITTANPETYAQAEKFPQKYDLVRCRQGGWSEYYSIMFPEHQRYIARRPYFGPSERKNISNNMSKSKATIRMKKRKFSKICN